MTGWQPIETAPKDGTWILLRGGEDTYQHETPPVVVAFWNTEQNCYGQPMNEWAFAHWDSDWRSVYENPTEWHPLPQ